jgi:hypothetical protein
MNSFRSLLQLVNTQDYFHITLYVLHLEVYYSYFVCFRGDFFFCIALCMPPVIGERLSVAG